jgi:MFS family permease
VADERRRVAAPSAEATSGVEPPVPELRERELPARQLPARARRARYAVAALFFTNGALFSNVVPRYPEIMEHVGVDKAGFGSAVAAFSVGALLAGLFAASLIARYRSARVATVGVALLGTAFFLVSLTSTWVVLAAVLLVAGGLDAVVDVAQNTHGLRVQRMYGRSILNSFHAVWSVGAIAGGAAGALAAGHSVPLTLHLGASGATCAAIGFGAHHYLLHGPEDAERSLEVPDAAARAPAASQPGGSGRLVAVLGRPEVRVLVALGVLAACGAAVEDAASSWGALYLGGRLGAGAAVAGLGFVVFQVAMTGGRAFGDRVVDRFGQARVVRSGGALGAVGMAVAVAVPTIPTALAGYALAGLGVATLVPATMHSADELPGLPRGVGLTVVSWLLRVGFLVAPPVVGIVSDAASLRVGLLGVVLAGGVVVALAGLLSPGTAAIGEARAGGPAPAPGGEPGRFDRADQARDRVSHR